MGEKGTLFEGGIRVPFIVKYPGVVESGTTNSSLTISYDFYPTFVGLANGKLPVNQTIDGVDLMPILKERSQRWIVGHCTGTIPTTTMIDRPVLFGMVIGN